MGKTKTRKTDSSMVVRCLYDKLVEIPHLNPHPQNRNTHPPDQIQRLAEILKYQGWRYPVKVSKRSGFVTAGHGRIEAAKINGWGSVPVNFQDYEDEAQEYADVVADNAIASWAELDLAGINADLGDLGPDFDLDMLGIKNFVLEVADKGLGDPDEVPDVPKVAKSKRGELWCLGDHRLLIDDCTVRENVERLMAGERADMVFTDPPYVGMVGAEWDKTDLDWEAVYASLNQGCSDEANVIVTGQTPIIFKWFPVLTKHFEFVQDMVWVKQRAVNLSHSIFARRHENVLWFRRGEKFFNKNKSRTDTHLKRVNKWSDIKMVKGRVGGLKGGEETVNGFSAQSVLEFGRVYHHHEEYEGHPTQKPTELISYLMDSLSKAECNTLDLFLGSGSTLIACEKTGRRCFGMEIEPLYGDVILSRWAKFTGRDPVREDGAKWSEVKNAPT